jgi:plastocyanin
LRKHFFVTVAAMSLAFAAFGPGLAGAESIQAPHAKISIVEAKGKLKFVAPATVPQGASLTVVNETDPKKVGPHTFSLVTQGSLPKTPGARKSCFTPKHICMSIAKWHGFSPKTEKITINPVEAGPEGWSTSGSNTETGDSWFTGEKKKGTSLTQQVTAEPGALYFVCAIHPWMQGKTTVLAAGS